MIFVIGVVVMRWVIVRIPFPLSNIVHGKIWPTAWFALSIAQLPFLIFIIYVLVKFYFQYVDLLRGAL